MAGGSVSSCTLLIATSAALLARSESGRALLDTATRLLDALKQ